MSKPAVLQLRRFPDWDQAPLAAAYDMIPAFNPATRTLALAERGSEIRAIATGGAIGADAATIAACPHLELIAVYGVGYDAVDLGPCRDRGIQVTNTPDVLTEDVADLAVGMLIAARRGIVGADHWVRQDHWSPTAPYPLQRRVHGSRAGILGLGRIGRAIATRLAGFGMTIAYGDLHPAEAPGDWTFVPTATALAAQVDTLFVTLSASEATRHIVNHDVLAALGSDGLLINVSRASNVDEDALITALRTGQIGGAALDVFAGEPAIDPRFRTLDKVLLQPHHASATVETRRAMGQLMRDNLAAHFAGQPLPTPVL